MEYHHIPFQREYARSSYAEPSLRTGPRFSSSLLVCVRHEVGPLVFLHEKRMRLTTISVNTEKHAQYPRLIAYCLFLPKDWLFRLEG